MMNESLRIGKCNLRVLGVIKGLLSEPPKMEEVFDSFRPQMMAVSLSKEELEGLRSMPSDFEPELTRFEEIYVAGLSRFGEVAAPPPCYVAALELAAKNGVPVLPVDLDEDSFSELYCAAVPAQTLFRHSVRTTMLKHRSFGARTAEEFVLAWDRVVNGLKGFRVIEERRAEAMAKGISAACKNSERVLAVIEYERAADVINRLKENG